jgi:hypothetical protein
VTKRVAMLVALVAIAGLLIYGGVHRTQAVLANESRGSGTVQTHDAQEGSGLESGQGGGLRDGSGQGRHGGGQATGGGEASGGSYTE